MHNNDNIDWKEVVATFSSYEGSLKDFCTMNGISKSQLYYKGMQVFAIEVYVC